VDAIAPFLDPNIGAFALVAYLVLRWHSRIEKSLDSLASAVTAQSALLGKIGRAVTYLAIAERTPSAERAQRLHDRALETLSTEEEEQELTP